MADQTFLIPQKGQRRKQQIMDAAKAMFMESGFQSTHIDQVCEKLRIARGTVYQYFRNKKEIIYSIIDSVENDVKNALDNDALRTYLASSPADGDIKEFIVKRISAGIAAILKEPIIIKLIFKDIQGIDSDIVNYVDKGMDTIRNNMAEEVSELQRFGFFRQDLDPFLTSSTLLGPILLIVYQYEKLGWDVLNVKVINSIARNYLDGVLALK